MQLAVRIAERGLGTTAPNPSVGAVLVRHDVDPAGIVVARGWTQPGGRPHAETEALRVAGEAALGATLYVTLEPCSHHGKTGPCARAVIASGVARVVVGIEDPDARVSGRGLAMLRGAGLEVVTGVEVAACRGVTLGHILRITERRPMVTIKMALTADLSVPQGRDGQPSFVTCPEARAAGHLLRAQSDAILVGSGTVRDDDPDLTCRLPGLANRSPRRIVLDGKLRALTPATKLARSAREVPVWVMTTAQVPHDARQALEAMGVRVSVVDSVSGRTDLDAIVRLLADDGITRLLVEGGRTVWSAFANRQLLDEAAVFVQGTKDAAETCGSGPSNKPLCFERLTGFGSEPPLDLVAQGSIGTDKYFRFERAKM